MPGFVLAIDQGTTGSTAVVLSREARVLAKANCEFSQHFPEPGWVEHDLGEIRSSIATAVGEALRQASVPPKDCAAIGVTNQRETTALWDRATRVPVYRAIVWQDRRTAARCSQLKERGREEFFRSRTGLVLDPYFSGTKVEWLLDHVDGARAAADAGKLAFGTIDSWLISELTGGTVHVTDASNASRTLLYNLHTGSWDPELASVLRVPMSLLPRVAGSSEVYGTTRGFGVLPDGIPVAGAAGDQQAALFGQTCFRAGEAKCTYGTGAFLLMNTGETPVFSKAGLLTTVAWRLGQETTFALEGSAFIAGAAVQWLRDGLKLIRSAAEIEPLARSVPSSDGVVFVPALTGLGAPYWDPHARGLIAGLTRGSTAAHIARATLEGIAFQIADLAGAMRTDAGRPLDRLRVDGGAAANTLLMQLQADLLGVTIDRPASVETTARGAAYLAGLGTGFFPNLDAIRAAHRIEQSYEPHMDAATRESELARWHQAVARSRSGLS